MNIKKLVTSPVFWSLAALISSACWCGEETTTQSAKIISATATPQPPQAKVICPMEWTSPTSSSDAGQMPPTGMIPFDWTDHPTASAYEMSVTTPNNSPVYYDTNGSSKNLFLENYKQAGSYQVTVTALDADGNLLCSISMNFDMPVVLNPVKNSNNGDNDSNDSNEDSGGGNPPSNGFTIPWIVLPVVTDEPVK